MSDSDSSSNSSGSSSSSDESDAPAPATTTTATTTATRQEEQLEEPKSKAESIKNVVTDAAAQPTSLTSAETAATKTVTPEPAEGPPGVVPRNDDHKTVVQQSPPKAKPTSTGSSSGSSSSDDSSDSDDDKQTPINTNTNTATETAAAPPPTEEAAATTTATAATKEGEAPAAPNNTTATAAPVGEKDDSSSSSSDDSSDDDEATAAPAAASTAATTTATTATPAAAAAEAPAAATTAAAIPAADSSSSSSDDSSDDDDNVAQATSPGVEFAAAAAAQQQQASAVAEPQPPAIRDEFADIQLPFPSQGELQKSLLAEVGNIRRVVEDEPIADDLQATFERDVADDTVVVGTLSLDDIRLQEMQMEEARVKAVEEDELRQARARKEIYLRKKEVKEDIARNYREAEFKMRRRKNRILRHEQGRQKEDQDTFRKMEDQLHHSLRTQKGKLKQTFGELKQNEDLYGAVRGRRYEVDWDLAPRLVRLRINWIRALKNKLPGGQYVVLATLYDRVGGHPLAWSKIGDNFSYTASTQVPQRHGGRFYNLELNFNQYMNRLFLACPARVAARPAMCIVFELFALRSMRYPVDTVVGWGVFPLSYPSGEIIKGKFKVPLLRGEMDRVVDKYSEIHTRLTTNVDSWLGNLYFEVKHMPRYMDNQREDVVQLDFTRNLLKLDERGNSKALIAKARAAQGDNSENEEQENDESANTAVNSGAASGGAEGGDESRKGGAGLGDGDDPAAAKESKITVKGDKKAKNDNKLRTADGYKQIASALSEDEDSGDDSDDLFGSGKKKYGMSMAKASTRNLGMLEDIDDEPMTESSKSARKRAKTLKKHKYAVTNVDSDIPVAHSVLKMRYLASEFVEDLSLGKWRTLEFWSSIVLLLAVFWFRMYIHYLGQWMYLETIRIPVFDFTPHIWYSSLLYPVDNIEVVIEIMVVIIGTLANVFVFVMLTLCLLAIRWAIGSFPDSFSRFLLALGIGMVLDPILILIVDTGRTDWQRGDAFKLYQWWSREEGSGIAGVILTVIIICVLVVFCSILFYHYLLHLHMNGRMLDVHYRLLSDESSFFLPDDMEISVRTLRWILSKAKKWVGFHGTTRKITITNYIVEDHLDPNYEDVTIHVAIWNVAVNHERDLWRHFIRRSDGSILELFDTVEDMGADTYRKMEESLLSKKRDVEELEAEELMRIEMEQARKRAVRQMQNAEQLEEGDLAGGSEKDVGGVEEKRSAAVATIVDWGDEKGGDGEKEAF